MSSLSNPSLAVILILRVRDHIAERRPLESYGPLFWSTSTRGYGGLSGAGSAESRPVGWAEKLSALGEALQVTQRVEMELEDGMEGVRTHLFEWIMERQWCCNASLLRSTH